MGLFNKQKLSLEEILKAIADLSEEEKAQVKAKIEEPTEGEEIASETETVDEQATEIAEETEEVGEVNEEPVVEEEVVETEETEVQPEEQTGETTVEETVTEEAEVEKPLEVQKQEKEQDDAQTVKIQALEEQVALIQEKLEQLMSSLDNKDFGLSPAVPEGGGEDHKRMSAVMQGYAGTDAKKYY